MKTKVFRVNFYLLWIGLFFVTSCGQRVLFADSGDQAIAANYKNGNITDQKLLYDAPSNWEIKDVAIDESRLLHALVLKEDGEHGNIIKIVRHTGSEFKTINAYDMHRLVGLTHEQAERAEYNIPIHIDEIDFTDSGILHVNFRPMAVRSDAVIEMHNSILIDVRNDLSVVQHQVGGQPGPYPIAVASIPNLSFGNINVTSYDVVGK